MSDDEKEATTPDLESTPSTDQQDAEKKKAGDARFGTNQKDLEEAKKRRQRAMEAKKAEREARGGGDPGDPPVIKIADLFADDPTPEKPPPKRATSEATPPRGGIERTQTDPTSMDRSNKHNNDMTEEEAEAMLLQQMNAMNMEARERDKATIKVKDKTLTKWPYDHYHLIQKDYWGHYFEKQEAEQLRRQHLADGDHSDSSTSVSLSSSDEEDWSDDDDDGSSSSSSSGDDDRSETTEERHDRKLAAKRDKKRAARRAQKKAEKKRLKLANRDLEKEAEARRKQRQKQEEEERAAGLHDRKSDILVFARPPDPPDLEDAVAGLPLTEFESVAKERAITLMSTWLFDAGLVQELMQTQNKQKKPVLPGTAGAGIDGHADLLHGVEPDGTMTGTPVKKKVSIQTPEKEPPKVAIKTPKDHKQQQLQEDGEEHHLHHQKRAKTKMDYEIEKLETTTRRQLEHIKARLNEGVNASGSEVQELVNSVVNTKSELQRLRQTSSMISNASEDADGVAGVAGAQTTFAINKYPHLKYAINARRNLQKCFRELTFFSQIPENCARLTDELNSSEWTEHEWVTLRNVCREHVQLEIFLVEAEAGMKKKQNKGDEDDEDEEDRQGRRSSAASSGFSRKAFMEVGLPHNHDEVDRFLKEHVQNVWELGDEIRMKILSGIAGAFDLALNNPAGMVALVEAVEIYESANREYQAVHGDEAGEGVAKSLRFTDMRAVALGELYKDMEARGQEVFEELSNQAEGGEDEDERLNKLFSAILRGANELTSEIGFVAEQMAPCFPPFWAIETIWTTCVAHLCSSQILTQIGGPEGENLPHLQVTQLLDLVAWVENFREIIEESFPDVVGNISSERTYFDEKPNLLAADGKTVDISKAKDSLAWVNNILWDAHDLAKVEFLLRTSDQTEEWLDKVYKAEHGKIQTTDGLLITSLCEDVYAIVGVQLRTIRERLTRKSEAMIQAVKVIFDTLKKHQETTRDYFLTDWECCCAGANDFVRMSERCEEIIDEIKMECTLSADAQEYLDDNCAAPLLGIYSTDAVYAAQKSAIFIFVDIAEDIGEELFSDAWLDELPDNDLAVTVYKTIDDFMEDLGNCLDDIMLQKTLEGLIERFIVYYVGELLKRATAHKGRDSYFADNQRALQRMNGDMNVVKEYFETLAEEDFPTLNRVIEREFDFFEAVHEIMAIAAGISSGDIRDFIYAFQRRIQKFEVTKMIVGDLYHLVNPSEEKKVYEIIQEEEEDLKAEEDENATDPANDRSTVPGLRLDTMMKEHIETSKEKRKRPGLSKEEGGGGGLFNW